MKAGPRQNERALLNAARQTDRRRRHRRRLLLPAANLNGGAGGIGDDPDLLVTPIVQSRTALRENNHRDESHGLEVHAIHPFTQGIDAISLWVATEVPSYGWVYSNDHVEASLM